MELKFEISEDDLKRLIVGYLENRTGLTILKTDVKIEVKSKQNFRSEWEEAQFRATYVGRVE